MKKFKNCLLSLPRTGSNWVRYWFEYFSNENTSERNILVETNHWEKPEQKKQMQHYINAINYQKKIL